MSESFFERWSRRKRDVVQQDVAQQGVAQQGVAQQEVALPETEPETSKVVEDLARDLSVRAPDAGESPAGSAEAPPAIDLSQLPSIESITADTDIRAFLAPGVPSALRHAALRRAWSADPLIRDYIGLSENAWDFTAPDGVPGFGPIGSPEEVQRLLAQLTGGWPYPAEKSGSDETADAGQPPVAVAESGAQEVDVAAEMSRALERSRQEQAAAPDASDPDVLQHNKEHVALQQEDIPQEYVPTRGRRPHGTALPE